MPFVNLNLEEALACCSATNGMPPSTLTYCIRRYLSPSAIGKEIKITLNNNHSMTFVAHQENGKNIITSLDCLISGSSGISVDELPEILAKLNELKIHFTALQFPNAFMVKGRLSETSYRAHFNHIVLYKDSSGQLNASIIDSTSNPIGVYNPIPVLRLFASTSIVSGEELLQVKLRRLLHHPIRSLQALCEVSSEAGIHVTTPICTSKQASFGDKRCGIYTLNAMRALINYIVSEEPVSAVGIAKTVAAAHQELNEPAMISISFPPRTSVLCAVKGMV